jgi:hypothetical protein
VLPWEQYTISPGLNWQVEYTTFSFEEQQEFQVEILLACASSDPVWIDLVALNPA